MAQRLVSQKRRFFSCSILYGPRSADLELWCQKAEETEGSSQEVFKMIFELRDNPLSVQSTYTLHRIGIVTEKRRRDTVEK